MSAPTAQLTQHGGLHLEVSRPNEYINRPALLPASLRGLVRAQKTVQLEGEITPVSVDQLCDPIFCSGLSFQRYRQLLSSTLHEVSTQKTLGDIPHTEWVLGSIPTQQDWFAGDGKYQRLWKSLGLPEDPAEIFARPPGELLRHPRLNAHRLFQLVRAIEARYGKAAVDRSTPGGIRRRVAALAAGPLSTLRFGDLRFGQLLATHFPDSTGSVAEAFVAWASKDNPAGDTARVQVLEELEAAAGASFAHELDALGRSAAASLFADASYRARNLRIFVRRHCALEEEGNTLQSIGDEYGMTRERVRQIAERMTDVIAEPKAWMPAGDRAFAVLKSLIPCTLVGLEANPAFHRALGGSVSVRAFLRFREFVSGSHGVSVGIPVGGVPPLRHMVDEDDKFRIVQVARSAMVKLCGHHGAAHISTVTWLTCEMGGYELSAPRIERVLEADPRFEWLERTTGWGWLGPDQATRVSNHLLKLFSVTGARSVDVEIVLTALNRNQHHGHSSVSSLGLPPTRILIEMLRRFPFLERVQYDDFRLRDPAAYPPAANLNSVEMSLYDLAKSNGGVFTRGQARGALVLSGEVSEPTLHQALAWSPITQPLGGGVYQLRGWIPAAGAVDKARQDVKASMGALQRGPNQPDRITGTEASFSFVVGKSMWSNGQQTIPRSIASWAIDRGLKAFELAGFPGRNLRLSVDEAKAFRVVRGMRPVSASLGMVEGQQWLLTLRADATCTLELSDESPGTGEGS